MGHLIFCTGIVDSDVISCDKFVTAKLEDGTVLKVPVLEIPLEENENLDTLKKELITAISRLFDNAIEDRSKECLKGLWASLNLMRLKED
jgi:hypothetical protein